MTFFLSLLLLLALQKKTLSTMFPFHLVTYDIQGHFQKRTSSLGFIFAAAVYILLSSEIVNTAS